MNPLPDDLLEKIIKDIEKSIDDNKELGDNAKAIMLRAALPRSSFYPENVLIEIDQRRGNKPLLSYLRSHKPFERAFGAYLGR